MKTAIIIANERKNKIDSANPTVLHKIIDKPMIEKVVDNFHLMNFDKIISVIDYDKDKITDLLKDKSEYAKISENVKMLKAVNTIKSQANIEGLTIVADANVPLITKSTYSMMLELVKEYPMVVLTAYADGFTGCDIITRNPEKTVRSIIKYEEASADQKAIREVNMNIYAFNNKLLFKYLDQLETQKEDYDVTDLVAVFKADGHKIMPLQLSGAGEAIRITSRKNLVTANAWERNRINTHWLENGVTIYDSETTIIGSDVKIGNDTIIYANNKIIGKTTIGVHNIFETDNKIVDSTIGDNNTIERSIVNKSKIGDENTLGPWANIRENVIIGNGNRVGSNVEMKKTQIKDNNAIAHNVYLGDTTVESHNNIGWGVVTANYDGNKKYKTTIGSYSFIGSSTTIIAPINIGNKAVVAAGSTITMDVEDHAMAIGRVKQVNKPERGIKYLEKEV